MYSYSSFILHQSLIETLAILMHIKLRTFRESDPNLPKLRPRQTNDIKNNI